MNASEHIDLQSRMQTILADPGVSERVGSGAVKSDLELRWCHRKITPLDIRLLTGSPGIQRRRSMLWRRTFLPTRATIPRTIASGRGNLPWPGKAWLDWVRAQTKPVALLNAALAYELAGYQANAAYLAREISPAVDQDSRADVQSLAASFIQRRLIVTTWLVDRPLAGATRPQSASR